MLLCFWIDCLKLDVIALSGKSHKMITGKIYLSLSLKNPFFNCLRESWAKIPVARIRRIVTHNVSIFSCILLLFAASDRQVDAQALKQRDQIRSSYDVAVIGADPEGIAAALAAAREGAKTLLVDTRIIPGGLFTLGWLNTIDLNTDRRNRPLNGGIFMEIYRQLDDHSFDVTEMEKILRDLIDRQENLHYVSGCATVLPLSPDGPLPLYRPGQTLRSDAGIFSNTLITEKKPAIVSAERPVTLTGLEIHFPNAMPIQIKAWQIIDATQDADIAVAAGCDFINYGEDVWRTTRNMAATVVLRLTGISGQDWQVMCSALQSRRDAGNLLGGRRNSVWGFGEVMRKFKASTPRIRMRGLNLGRQKDGSVLVNALLIFYVDGLCHDSRNEARRLAEAEFPALEKFLQQNIPGMASVKIAETAPELYIRTSRQIKTHYILTVDDVLENADFDDRIGFGSYPLDIQAQTSDHFGDVTGKPEQYALPLRCFVPVGAANLTVVGRSAGFDSLAQASARTVPVGIAAGQAAGIAAAMCLEKNDSLDVAIYNSSFISELQKRLANQGVQLQKNTSLKPPKTGHWAYPGLKFMRKRGQISGGYGNEYGLDGIISRKAFTNRLLNLATERRDTDWKWLYDSAGSSENITLEQACQLLLSVEQFLNAPSESTLKQKPATSESAFSELERRGFFAQPWPQKQLNPDSLLTRGAAYMLLIRWACKAD